VDDLKEQIEALEAENRELKRAKSPQDVEYDP